MSHLVNWMNRQVPNSLGNSASLLPVERSLCSSVMTTACWNIVTKSFHLTKSTKHIVILTPGFAAGEDDDTCLPAQQEFVLALQSIRPFWKISIIALQY